MNKLIVGLILIFSVQIPNAYAFTMTDYIEKSNEVKESLNKELLKLDINFDVNFGDIDLIDGINLAAKYHYDVQPSYKDKYFSRMDKWDVNANINAGTLLKNVVELPFSFGVAKNNSFIFVRQFQTKSKALEAIPYTPQKLPINADRAIKLMPGDFVSIPATLNLATQASASSSYVMPGSVINGNASLFYVVSGEYTIQVYKLDETHVRVKLISSRSQNLGASTTAGFELNVFGFKVFGDSKIDELIGKQTTNAITRLIDKDLIQFGINYTPGATFIADYVFDLTDDEAKLAYNQILGTSYKLKDVLVTNDFLSGQSLQNQLITTTDLADQLVDKYKDVKMEDRKVVRVFKGFNNYKSSKRHIKLGLFLTSYQKDLTYNANKITFVDKNNSSFQFYYPTYTKYFETKFGKWFFDLKDQQNKNFFGLIPRRNNENVDQKDPDIGVTFERKDKLFTTIEQSTVEKFMIGQLPIVIAEDIDLSEWKTGFKKSDVRIYFQLILKAQGFKYLRDYSLEELKAKLLEYSLEKKQLHLINQNDTNQIEVSSNVLSGYAESVQMDLITNFLYKSLHNEKNISEGTLMDLIKLNEIPLFDQLGVGFLISLVPQEQLKDLIYVKLEMIGKDMKKVEAEYGKLNYQALYTEINTLSARLSNRSYDLRLSNDDIEMSNSNTEVLPDTLNK